MLPPSPPPSGCPQSPPATLTAGPTPAPSFRPLSVPLAALVPQVCGLHPAARWHSGEPRQDHCTSAERARAGEPACLPGRAPGGSLARACIPWPEAGPFPRHGQLRLRLGAATPCARLAASMRILLGMPTTSQLSLLLHRAVPAARLSSHVCAQHCLESPEGGGGGAPISPLPTRAQPPSPPQVNTHGSGLTYSFFMPGGTGVVEILAWNFHGQGCTWADQYFRLCVCVCVCVCARVCVCVINVRGRFDNAPASLHAADAGHSVRHAQCGAAAPPQLGQPLLA